MDRCSNSKTWYFMSAFLWSGQLLRDASLEPMILWYQMAFQSIFFPRQQSLWLPGHETLHWSGADQHLLLGAFEWGPHRCERQIPWRGGSLVPRFGIAVCHGGFVALSWNHTGIGIESHTNGFEVPDSEKKICFRKITFCKASLIHPDSIRFFC